MQNIFLCLAVIATFSAMGYAIKKGEDLIGSSLASSEKGTETFRDILCFGGDEKIREELDFCGHTFDLADRPQIPLYHRYRLVLAVSDSDADNLLLCVQAMRKFPGVRTIALCSSSEHEKLFEEKKAGLIVSNQQEALAAMKKDRLFS